MRDFPTDAAAGAPGGRLKKSRAGAAPDRFAAPDARILVVDDIKVNLLATAEFLGEYRCRVDTCTSGMAALHMVQSRRYDMVFMDYMMPGMNGSKAMQRIRALEGAYLALPIVALTANASCGAREVFLSQGFSDYISKPIEALWLGRILRRWLPEEKLQRCAADSGAREALPDYGDFLSALGRKPVAPEPSPALLRELARASRQFRGGEVEGILDRLEACRYDSGGDFLVKWLRKQADSFEYRAICERLEAC